MRGSIKSSSFSCCIQSGLLQAFGYGHVQYVVPPQKACWLPFNASMPSYEKKKSFIAWFSCKFWYMFKTGALLSVGNPGSTRPMFV